MNRASNGSPSASEKSEPQVSFSATPSGNGNALFLPDKRNPTSFLKHNRQLIFVGSGIIIVLLLLAFNGLSRGKRTHKGVTTPQTQRATQPENPSTASITPILDAGRSSEQEPNSDMVNPDQIGHLAKRGTNANPARTLGDIRPFSDLQNWQAAPYQPGSAAMMSSERPRESPEGGQSKDETNFLSKASLVFVRSNATSPITTPTSRETIPEIEFGIGLTPGTKLRARLESAINSAVSTPVVAVVEYNYEQNGEIVVPAGAKALGRLETADRSGYVALRFDSLLTPDGSSVPLEAAATDLQLRPLRGRVEGKHGGKNILVRSFAGVGEVAATFVGRGSLNQPLSDQDLLRARISNNIGETSDERLASLAVTEHLVVSVPGGTEIYVILQKPVKERAVQNPLTLPTQQSGQPNLDELRQLLQLERELKQSSADAAVR